MSKHTFNADVAGLEVAADLARARQAAVVNGSDDDGAPASAGAERVKLVKDVQLTAKVAVVDGQAAAKSHASEVCRLHHDHLVFRRTTGDENFSLAELRHDT